MMTTQGEPITTTRQEEQVTPATEGEPMTSSEGANTGEGETTTTNIEGTTSQSTQEPVSEKVTTATNSEPATDSTSSNTTLTATATMDMPTDPALTTPPPPPVLDVMTNGESFTVMHGSSLTLECHVTGGGAGTTLSWFFNGTKLPNVGVAQPNIDKYGLPRLSSLLNFDLIEPFHAGLYTCEAYSPVNSQTVVAPIQVKVTRKLEITAVLLLGENVK